MAEWPHLGLILLAFTAALAVFVFVWRPIKTASVEARFAQARRDFHAQRERLEMKFVLLASMHAGPNGPHWDNCDFDDDVAYVRNRNTGELSAFVGVNVVGEGFDPPPGDIAGVLGQLHAGTVIFRFDGTRWETEGRAILNLSPAEAIRRYQHDLEMVDREPANRARTRPRP